MRTSGYGWRRILCLALPLALVAAVGLRAQDAPAKKERAPAPLNRLTIEVTGGEGNRPVENASVYVKTIEQRLIKDKKSEVNVKTNQLGVAHIPSTFSGRVLIQVVAEGWKTYGHWHEITEANQTIKVHLDRPPKWY